MTPTTCASVNGDDDDHQSLTDDLLQEEGKIFTNVDSLPTVGNGRSERWADISDSVSDISLSSLEPPMQPEFKEVKPKPVRRSGRARQREAQRRRMRTPSPEMRSADYAELAIQDAELTTCYAACIEDLTQCSLWVPVPAMWLAQF